MRARARTVWTNTDITYKKEILFPPWGPVNAPLPHSAKSIRRRLEDREIREELNYFALGIVATRAIQ